MRQPQQPEWTLDLWFVDEPDRQPDLAHVQPGPARVTPETPSWSSSRRASSAVTVERA
jgi:hypothetical protein